MLPRWSIHNLSGLPIPVSHYPHHNFFPCFQSKSMPFQFKTVFPCSVITSPSKKSLSIFVVSPLYVGHNEVSLLFSRLPSLLQLSNPSSLKLSSHEMCSSLLIIGRKKSVFSKAGRMFRTEVWPAPTIRQGKGKQGRGRWKQMQRLPVSFRLLQLAFIRDLSIPTQTLKKNHRIIELFRW